MTDLNELLERVRSATGPDRELDADLIKALGCHSWAGRMRYHDEQMWVDFGGSNITASIDAALGLVERVLPGHDYIIGHTNGGLTIHCRLGPNEMEFGATAPLAILAALLQALTKERTNVQ